MIIPSLVKIKNWLAYTPRNDDCPPVPRWFTVLILGSLAVYGIVKVIEAVGIIPVLGLIGIVAAGITLFTALMGIPALFDKSDSR